VVLVPCWHRLLHVRSFQKVSVHALFHTMSLYYPGNDTSFAALYPIPEHSRAAPPPPTSAPHTAAAPVEQHILARTGHQARAHFSCEEELARDARDLATAVATRDNPMIAQKTVEVAAGVVAVSSGWCAWLCPRESRTQPAPVPPTVTARPVNPTSFPPSVERSTQTRS
jgi:hypothetical protein